MTIQFRYNIKSVTTDDYFLSRKGCCCTGSNNIGEQIFFPYPTSYSKCNADGGYFVINDDLNFDDCSNLGPCPTKGITGCCCACSYGGITEGIEFDVCQDLNGNWQQGPCPEDTDLCISGSIDFRNKKACCGYTLIGGNPTSRCFDVCTEKECFDLRYQELASTYYPVGGACAVLNPSCSSSQIQSLNDNITEILGNCCVQGFPCTCYTNLSFNQCELINGSFYLTTDPEFSCDDCINNCSEIM